MVHPGLVGGRFQPLTDTEVERIHDTALTLLDEIGMANPIPILKEKAISAGCRLGEQGRLCFPRALVEDVIAAAPRDMVLYGRDARHDIEYRGTRVHFGASGEAVRLLDPNTGTYRPSTLLDIYDCGRLVDSLEHIHDYSRWMIATDLNDIREADINTAYACLLQHQKTSRLVLMMRKILTQFWRWPRLSPAAKRSSGNARSVMVADAVSFLLWHMEKKIAKRVSRLHDFTLQSG